MSGIHDEVKYGVLRTCQKQHTHTQTSKENEIIFPFGLSQELGAAFNYLDKKSLGSVEHVVDLNN
jgi:hypothetical protein